MEKKKMKLVLASASPRRKELLERLGLDFSVQVSKVDEKITCSSPAEAVKELAVQKAEAVAEELCRRTEEEVLVIGADTVVVLEEKILGKPGGFEEACRMLRELSGRAHQVCTGVALVRANEGKIQETRCFSETTEVHVAMLSEKEIQSYAATGEPLDKAGAYGIQGRFAPYISGISGDYYNVVGLPLHALYQELKKTGGILEW